MKLVKFMWMIPSITLSLLEIACSPKDPKTENQFRDQTTPPSPQHLLGNLQLTSESDKKLIFEGPVAIWDNNVKWQDLGKVLNQKDILVEEEMFYKRDAFSLEIKLTEFYALKRNLESEISELKNYSFFDKIAEKSIKTIETTAEWSDTNITDINSLNYFCQSYIWRMAASEKIASFRYSRRPKLPIICESRQSHLFSSESCVIPDGEESRNFQSCFWDAAKQTNLKFYRGNEYKEETDQSIIDSIINYLWSDEGLRSRIKLAIGNKPGILGKINNDRYFAAFSSKTSDRQLEDTITKLTDLLSGKFGIDFISSSSLEGFKAILATKNPNMNPPISYNLHDLMFNLGYLVNPDQQDGEKIKINPNDLLEIKSLSETEAISKLLIKITDDEIGEIAEIAALIDQKTLQIRDHKTQLDKKITTAKKLESDWIDSKGKTALYMLQNNMIEALWGYSEIKVNIKKGYHIEMLFRPLAMGPGEKNIFAKACFNAVTNEVLSCDFKENEFPMDLIIDQNTGKITFQISDTYGKSFYPEPDNSLERGEVKNPFYQSETLTPEFLQNGILRMEIFSGSYKGIVPRLTGKLFFYDKNGEKIYDGEISLSQFSQLP